MATIQFARPVQGINKLDIYAIADRGILAAIAENPQVRHSKYLSIFVKKGKIGMEKYRLEFEKGLNKFVDELKKYVSTDTGDWTIKGFIDIYKNIYTISSDTKIVSKILEIHIFPEILRFAENIGYKIILAEHQNWYPDLTFVYKQNDKIKFALDLKTTFRRNNSTAGFTLGSHGAYFKERDKDKNIQFPYNQYVGHYCLWIIYTRADFDNDLAETEIYQINELQEQYGDKQDSITDRKVTKLENLKSITSRGYQRADTIKAIIYLLTGKLDFQKINPHYSTHLLWQRTYIMDNLTLMLCLLPIFFMIHDFEEIIFFKPWINKNRAYLRERFPRLSKKFLPRFESLSTSGFALAVAEEFVLLSFITYFSVYINNYYLWFAAFMGFFIHLIMHVVQWIILKRYIPVIITSLISLPYCAYTFIRFLEINIFQVFEIILLTFIGLLLMGINVLFAHKLGEKLDRRINNF